MNSQGNIHHFQSDGSVSAEIIILETEPGMQKVEEIWEESLDSSRGYQRASTLSNDLDDFLSPTTKKSIKAEVPSGSQSMKDLDAFFDQPRGRKSAKGSIRKADMKATIAVLRKKSDNSKDNAKEDILSRSIRESAGSGMRLESGSDGMHQQPSRAEPKVVLTVKVPNGMLSTKEEELISDCVESLAEQECISKLKLKERVNTLCMTEWKRVAETMVLLMKNHLPPNGFETIEFRHLREARIRMRDTYAWAGYVTGRDCHPNDNISSIAQDTCYNWMRKKKNWANQKKVSATKRTAARISNPTDKKFRTAGSYGVIPCQHSDISSIEDEKLLRFIAFSRELDETEVGEISNEQVKQAKTFFDCAMTVFKSAKPDKMEELKFSGNLAILRHFRIYYDYVLLITNRQNTLHKTFQEKCHTYLACLKDIFKFFPPANPASIINLDVANKPYMSLAKIIASQLHRRSSFIIDEPLESEQAMQDAGLICIVEEDADIYGLWINGTCVVQGMTELQALFAFASIEDVMSFNQMQTSDSCEVIDFLRKYFLTLPDFAIKRKLLSQLGQAFFTFSTIEAEKHGGQLKVTKADSCKMAHEALMLLSFTISTS